ncbi:hypothetical protein BCR32DRAFT_264057 [Anaeromyces robustus]|uniref:Uncharacterized protein n=1 Tax=Anaeromyces robustus TaxID=1754192 RepID=A0A1Y1XPY6_9FUNG|nr:hypothetical protein BCR32DRAFT_264057 [Anaeromyces robustus]|eukprot:ORX87819.1 hypothetical protein BCR32DRAFT_264057 [Anaeromyces robustus]
MDVKYKVNDKIELELRSELRKWHRSNTPSHIYCKEADISPPILGITLGDFFNFKTIEAPIKPKNDLKHDKYDILTMPINNHSIENKLENNNTFKEKKSTEVKNYTNIIVEKKESPAVQFIQNSYSSYTSRKNPINYSKDKGVKINESNNSNIVIENNSKLRITALSEKYNILMNNLMSVPYIPLHSIKRRDDPGKWYTIGIMVGKSSLKKTVKGDNYAMIQIGNLKDIITNIFIFGNNIEKIKDKQIGQVLAICHAKTMIPAEKDSSIALNIDKESQIYTLGKSVDLCFCKEKKKNGRLCNIPLDRRESEICEYHIVEKYKQFKNKRQEFANGNFRFQMEQNNHNSIKKSVSGTYKFKDSTISTFNGNLKLSQFNKFDKKPHISEEDNKFLERLKQNNSYGIHLLKRIGVNSKLSEINRNTDKKKEEKLLNIHPPEALLKMGIRAPINKSLKNKVDSLKLENNFKKEKEIVLDFNDDKNILNSNNKREIKISFLSDEENEEEEKNHFKKFLEMKM